MTCETSVEHQGRQLQHRLVLLTLRPIREAICQIGRYVGLVSGATSTERSDTTATDLNGEMAKAANTLNQTDITRSPSTVSDGVEHSCTSAEQWRKFRVCCVLEGLFRYTDHRCERGLSIGSDTNIFRIGLQVSGAYMYSACPPSRVNPVTSPLTQ